MKSLLKKLGLAEDASEESAVAALQIIQNRASQVETLTTEVTTLRTAQVETDLEKYKGRYKVENREKMKALLISNRAGTIELLEAIEAPAAVVTKEDPKQITNRQTAKTPAQVETEQTAAKTEEGRAARIQNRALEIQKQKSAGRVRYPFSQAFKDAEAENPSK